MPSISMPKNLLKPSPFFEEDLKTFPKNGWALSGLKTAYTQLKQNDKMNDVSARLNDAWAHADVQLDGARVVMDLD